MGKSTTASNNWLKLLFNATNWALIADNTATTPLTSLYVALHTADPGVGGTQSTNEVTYTSYARVAVARTTGGWTASSAAATSPVANISFPAGTGGSGIATYWSIGTLASGAGVILYSGTVTPNITLGTTITPVLTSASTITET